ncbi:hypothetical protein HA402_007539 [Bradysia odoriphaga]|nr:hypothetical protein HA402_007539 [Bradysia odoriphaga]
MHALLNNMLSNRQFYVFLEDNVSRQRTLNDGLTQGAVLSCLLFVLYASDAPETTSRKFIFADDFAMATQSTTFMGLEFALTKDLDIMRKHFVKWRLKPNPQKTKVSVFHLRNSHARRELRVLFEGKALKHDFFPKYLGATMDRALTFKTNSEKLAAKLATRINLLRKLAGTTWGADANVLRTTALSLVYSVAEYCAPIWLKCAHTDRIDVQLNEALRIISGTVASTPVEWLSVLANIEPPSIRRIKAFVKEWEKQQNSEHMPIHIDLNNLPGQRLTSRNPSWLTYSEINLPFRPGEEWKAMWDDIKVKQCELIIDPNEKPLGFNLPRKAWIRLNRIRTGHGNCGHFLFLWNQTETTACDCGAPDHDTYRQRMPDQKV